MSIMKSLFSVICFGLQPFFIFPIFSKTVKLFVSSILFLSLIWLHYGLSHLSQFSFRWSKCYDCFFFIQNLKHLQPCRVFHILCLLEFFVILQFLFVCFSRPWSTLLLMYSMFYLWVVFELLIRSDIPVFLFLFHSVVIWCCLCFSLAVYIQDIF